MPYSGSRPRSATLRTKWLGAAKPMSAPCVDAAEFQLATSLLTLRRNTGRSSSSNHGLAMNQATLRGEGCGSGIIPGACTRQLRVVAVTVA